MQITDSTAETRNGTGINLSVNEKSIPELLSIAEARKQFNSFTVKKIDPTVHRDLQLGWVLPILLMLDDWLWKRWEYGFTCAIWQNCQPNPYRESNFFILHIQARERWLRRVSTVFPTTVAGGPGATGNTSITFSIGC
jgi:hypothetical protein